MSRPDPFRREPAAFRRALPAVPAAAAAGIEGLAVLREVDGDFGHALWLSLRSVLLWTRVRPAARGELFAAGAQEVRLAHVLLCASPEPVQRPLEQLARLLGEATTFLPFEVAVACQRIAEWALEAGKPATALEFMQAAARARPDDPRLALQVGRIARDQALYPCARGWLARAVVQARQIRDWDCYARGHIAFGRMLASRGALGAGRRHFARASRAAERRGLREPWGMALHELFNTAVECGELDTAEQYAAAAMHAYGPGHPLMVNLAHDIAYFWMEQGRFARALPLFVRLVPRLAARHMPHVHGAIARSAGGVGDAAQFRAAAASLAACATGVGVAAAWNNVGQGALSLALWSEAVEAAQRAREIAAARAERKEEMLAESIVDCASRRLPGARDVLDKPAAAPAGGAAADYAGALADSLDKVPQLR